MSSNDASLVFSPLMAKYKQMKAKLDSECEEDSSDDASSVTSSSPADTLASPADTSASPSDASSSPAEDVTGRFRSFNLSKFPILIDFHQVLEARLAVTSASLADTLAAPADTSASPSGTSSSLVDTSAAPADTSASLSDTSCSPRVEVIDCFGFLNSSTLPLPLPHPELSALLNESTKLIFGHQEGIRFRVSSNPFSNKFA
jgi:hypothetical protein